MGADMSDGKKRRLSMLDGLTAAGAPAPPQMTQNRALRAARDAVDGHHVWDLDPHQIEDTRIKDRLDPADVYDLRDAIEANGQTVPILVRRHPTEADRYLLVYGRRRLEAIRQSDKVAKVRALVANLDEEAAVKAQISENMARRDLSFIEKALFARELVDQGFGTQSQVAEVLTVAKSAISMALAVVETVGVDLARAVGPAHGVGRPRWEALARAIQDGGTDPGSLHSLANDVRDTAERAEAAGTPQTDPSTAAFEAVLAEATRRAPRPSSTSRPSSGAKPRKLTVGGQRSVTLGRTARGLRVDVAEGAFADWLEREADTLMNELHARWSSQAED